MAWIAKRPCRVQRDGKTVVILPGESVPEAGGWTNPTMWCVWSPDQVKASVEKKSTTENVVETSESDKNLDTNKGEGDPELKKHPDYTKESFKDLRVLAKKAQEITKDTSSEIKKATKDELIATIKSVSVEDLEG